MLRVVSHVSYYVMQFWFQNDICDELFEKNKKISTAFAVC
jgi:hypothetical protein